MPNHVATRIRANQEVLDALLDADGRADFEKLIPMPEKINRETLSFDQMNDPMSWYAWSLKNWGTKWNAYDSKMKPGELKFETAWKHPEPVIKTLSENFPDHVLCVVYADEDRGNNCGGYYIHAGEITTRFNDDDMAEDVSRNFACLARYNETWDEFLEGCAEELEGGESARKYDPFALIPHAGDVTALTKEATND